MKSSQKLYNGHMYKEEGVKKCFCKPGYLEAFDDKSLSGLGK